MNFAKNHFVKLSQRTKLTSMLLKEIDMMLKMGTPIFKHLVQIAI